MAYTFNVGNGHSHFESEVLTPDEAGVKIPDALRKQVRDAAKQRPMSELIEGLEAHCTETTVEP